MTDCFGGYHALGCYLCFFRTCTKISLSIMIFKASIEDSDTFICEPSLLQFSVCSLFFVHLMFALLHHTGNCLSGPICWSV